jgi:hypothetical protein
MWTQLLKANLLFALSSPALATLGSFSSTNLPGFNLQEAWDLSEPPLSEFSTSDYSCPLMVSVGGFSHRIFPRTLKNFLVSTAPLFIPNGEDVAGTVQVDDTSFLRAYFLPAQAHLPTGMSWRLQDLTVDLISQLAKSFSNPPNPFTHFNHVITTLTPTLSKWLTAAKSDPLAFSIQAFPYSALVSHFPYITSGDMPSSISCSTTFLALMDMGYLYGWRLFIDKLLSGIIDADIRFFCIFLTRAASCLHSGTYVGVELLPELTPNMCLHFISAGGLTYRRRSFPRFMLSRNHFQYCSAI